MDFFTPKRALVMFASALIAAGALGCPFLLSGFAVYQIGQALIYAIALLGLNLLTGVSGQFSFGHSAFFALGAYAGAILSEQAGLSYGLALPLAGLACLGVGFLFGLPLARLEGVYLAMATFALAAAAPQIFKLSILEPWTGGSQGFAISKPAAPFGLPLSEDQWLYFIILTCGILLSLGARNVENSRVGRALRALGENQLGAGAMGVNAPLYKAAVFGISAAYAGIAGALSVMAAGFIAPDAFSLSLSIGLLTGLMIGGAGWRPGALFGGAFLVFAPNLAEGVSKGFSGAIYGGLLLGVAMLAPAGVGGLVRRLRDGLKLRHGKTNAGEKSAEE